ncbi:hypothetical protein [Burkholderia ubonensis]|uniref:hypothetical protein n=1 Tax=Burkholderia ubonensis TaxID=101571 RepID=UPI000A90C6F2|nr:hypothetical protein [Burkholderia ubonensis]
MTILKLCALVLMGASAPFAWKGWTAQSTADLFMACVLALAALGLVLLVASNQKDHTRA